MATKDLPLVLNVIYFCSINIHFFAQFPFSKYWRVLPVRKDSKGAFGQGVDAPSRRESRGEGRARRASSFKKGNEHNK